MAAPRKKKKTPPFDVTGIDFSAITTALETGGKMIEQIMNGIQYGSPEVRLLMLEECDFILECRVCRGLFRALPNFIAHKRVYCCRAYSDFVHDSNFQSAATVVVPPPEQVVILEPEAPEDAPTKNVRLSRQAKDRGKEQRKDRVDTDPSSAATAKKPNKAQADSGKGSGKQPASLDSGVEKSNGKTRSQQSEKPADKTVESLRKTVAQIESGQLGKSQEYAFYTAAANKAEREKKVAESSAAFHLTPIPATPCAVFVNKGSVPGDQTGLPSAVTEVREKQPAKNSPKEGSTPVLGQEQAVSKSTSGPPPTTVTPSNAEQTKKPAASKAALRGVSRVVKELRQKKEECAAKELVSQSKDVAQKSILLSILSESKTRESSTTDGSNPPADVKPPKDKPQPSPTPSNRSTYQSAEAEHKEGSLRAVVKRCLTGRPGSVRVSPFKPGEWGVVDGGDTVSEAGSHYSDKGEAQSPLLRQDSNGEQGAIDVDNLRCTICNKQFSGRKTLMYHCQSRHSGQRTIFPCPYCPRVFYYFWGLTRHLNTNHKKTRSDIDRMRKGLHRKAYKQNVVEEHISNCGDFSQDVDSKGKSETPRKFRPSVHAKKMVAASKSVSPSSSGDVKKSPPTTLFLPKRRRRVEVITSINSKCKQSANLYKKVYANKKTESSLGSPVAVGSFSSPLRTRKLVAKALRTTRSKRVYNRTDIESPPVSPEKVVKKTLTKTTRTLPSLKGNQNPHVISISRTSLREKLQWKEGPKEGTNATPAAVQRDSRSQSQNQDSKVSESSSSSYRKPVTRTPIESSASKDRSQGGTVRKNEVEPSIEAKSQPQTRTRTSSGLSDVAAATKSGSTSSASGPRVSRVSLSRDPSPRVMDRGRSLIKVKASKDGQLAGSSGLLHICPHCHRAFGRKISLDSHINVCTKAKASGVTSQAAEKESVHEASSLTHKNTGKKGGEVSSSGDSKSQDVQARTVRSSSRTLRESSVEKSEPKSRLEPRLSAHPHDLKSDSKPSSSRESSADCQVASDRSVDRQSRSRRVTDSKASSSRESSVDSVRTRRSDSKPSQPSAERTSHAFRRESESSRDSWVDGGNPFSNPKMTIEDNLLTLSRQRLSEQLLAATSSRDKEPAVSKPRSQSQRGSASRDSLSDLKKTDLLPSAVARNSPEKNASPRAVTTSVLRKGLKGKVTDCPRRASVESLSVSPSTSASPVKLEAAKPKPVQDHQAAAKSAVPEESVTTLIVLDASPTKSGLQEKPAAKPVLQDKAAAKPALQDKLPAKTGLQDKLPAKSLLQDKLPAKSLLQDKLPAKSVEQDKAAAKSIEQDKAATKPVEQDKAVTRTAVQDKAAAKSVEQDKAATKPVEQEKAVTRTAVQDKAATKSVEQDKAATKPVEQEKAVTRTAVQDKAATKSVEQDKAATKPVEQDKYVTRTAVQDKAAAKSVEQDKAAAKSVEQDKAATKSVEQDKAVTRTAVQDKAATKRVEQDKAATKSVEQDKAVTRTAVQDKAAAKSAVQDKAATKSVEQDKAATKSVEQDKAATKSVEQDKAVTRTAVQDKAAAKSVEQDKAVSVTKYVEQDKAVTRTAVQDKAATKSVEQDKAVTKSVEQDKAVTRTAVQEKSATRTAVEDKSAAKPEIPDKLPTNTAPQDKLPTKTSPQEKQPPKPAVQKQPETKPKLQEKAAAKPQLQEKAAAKLVPQEKSPLRSLAHCPQTQDTSTLLKSEAKLPDSSSVQPPNLPQKPAASAETVGAEAPSSQPVVSPATERGSSSRQPPPGLVQESPPEVNQRPRRKRRAPARVLDSQVTLPKSIAPPRKKACLDGDLEQGNPKEDPGSKRTVSQRDQDPSSGPRTRRDHLHHQQEDQDPDPLTGVGGGGESGEEGGSAQRSHQVQTVEEIVDETGLTCRHCQECFTSVSNLRRHAIRHLGWKRFKCRLCCFCSYNRSECNTHIVRTHFDRVRLGSNTARIDSFITDLSRQGASVRSLKIRQTMDRQRQGGEEGGAPFTHIRSSSRGRTQPASPDLDLDLDPGQEMSVDRHGESSSTSPVSRRSTSRGKTAVTTETAKSKPTISTSFNISTRNSPRNFDTRPYSRDHHPATLNTRKGAYVKRNLSFSSLSSAEAAAAAEESKKADVNCTEKVSGQVTVPKSVATNRDSSLPRGQSQTGHKCVENESHSAAKQDGAERTGHCGQGAGKRNMVAGKAGEEKTAAGTGGRRTMPP
ncbi:hypothetical protein ACOMHN_052478 [Nucella lapillus]